MFGDLLAAELERLYPFYIPDLIAHDIVGMPVPKIKAAACGAKVLGCRGAIPSQLR